MRDVFWVSHPGILRAPGVRHIMPPGFDIHDSKAAIWLPMGGTYGVLSYLVTERQREIGIRMALGADRTSVLGLMLEQGPSTTLIGLVLGVGGALALTRLASSLLFEVRPTDRLTFGALRA